MIIAIDAGNSRIKWGIHGAAGWLDVGVLATADVACLSEAADANTAATSSAPGWSRFTARDIAIHESRVGVAGVAAVAGPAAVPAVVVMAAAVVTELPTPSRKP